MIGAAVIRAASIVLLATACGRVSFDARIDAKPAPDADPGDRYYPDFGTCPSDLVRVGVAQCVNGMLELTPLQADVAGAFWIDHLYSTAASVLTEAVVQMATDTSTPGDGIVLVMHADPRGTSAIGYFGVEIGYGGITPSLAVELDEFGNAPTESAPHVATHANGDPLVALTTVPAPLPLSDGVSFTLWVDYDASARQTSVFVGRGGKPATPQIVQPDDLRRLGPTMWIGLTAATGNYASSHRVQSLRVLVPQ